MRLMQNSNSISHKSKTKGKKVTENEVTPINGAESPATFQRAPGSPSHPYARLIRPLRPHPSCLLSRLVPFVSFDPMQSARNPRRGQRLEFRPPAQTAGRSRRRPTRRPTRVLRAVASSAQGEERLRQLAFKP
jgi:hypothetical protein